MPCEYQSSMTDTLLDPTGSSLSMSRIRLKHPGHPSSTVEVRSSRVISLCSGFALISLRNTSCRMVSIYAMGKRPSILAGAGLCLSILTVGPLSAQNAFDVVSVRPNLSRDGPSDPRVSPGRLSWANATLRQLIQVGYDVRPFQVIGMPDWAETARFDVAATASSTASPQQLYRMLQGLLADRFDFAGHRDRREVPVYALVLARRDGRLGPGIHSATVDCESITTRPLVSETAQAAYAGCLPQMGLTRLKAAGFRISSLASGLMRILDRSVVDKTGLSGTFDIELSWAPDPTMLPTGVPAPTGLPPGAASIFSALEEQLGLKLVADRAPVEVLVIDRVNRLKPD
jgi:uncharacterized protein (TIGR03435 family)